MQSIHCKVSARGSIRRFALSEAKFSALHCQVAAVFGLSVSNDAWTIKYKDDEGTMVTISSDEELSFAVQLLGSLMHLEVVEKAAFVGTNIPESQNLDEENWKHHKRQHREKRDKKEKSCHREKHDKCDDLARLTKKQDKICKRLDALKLDADQPRQKAQAEKLQLKLTAITAKIEKKSEEKSEEIDQSGDQMVVEPIEVAPVPLPLALPEATQTADPAFDKQQFKEISKTFHVMRRDFHSEQKKLHAMIEVAKALKVLSRHGNAAQSPLQVDPEQAKLAKESLISQKLQLVQKKEQLKKQSELFKMINKQRGAHLKGIQKKQHKRGRCQGDDRKKCREERANKFQDKRERLEMKAVKQAEKAKRKAEKASKQTEKAEKYALKAQKHEEKAAKRAKKREDRERAPVNN